MPMQNKTPISIDVSISLTALTTAINTDMTRQCFVTKNVDFLSGNRYRIVSSSDDILNITNAGSSLYYALNTFFGTNPRPSEIVVARVFEADQAAYLAGGNVDLASLQSVSDGAFKISIDDEERVLSALNFTGSSTLAEVANVLNTAMTAYATVSAVNATLLVQSKTTGSTSTIGFAESTAGEEDEQTDVSAMLGLTEATGGQIFQGYVHGSIAEEAQHIADALQRGNAFCFGWTMDADFRDTPEQFEFAEWIKARSYRAQAALVSNSVASYSATSTSDLGAKCLAANMLNVACFYDDNPQSFPDIEYLAKAQAVDYNAADSTINMKYQTADTPAVNFPNITTDLAVLENKKINTITGYIGQNINIFRPGCNSHAFWYTDMWMDVCNFIAEVEIAALNVFLRNNKITYTSEGQNKFLSAISEICEKYVTNNAYADRIIADKTTQNGLGLSPAYTLDIQALENVTAAQRTAREGTPITIYLNPTNAMNTIAINIYEQ